MAALPAAVLTAVLAAVLTLVGALAAAGSAPAAAPTRLFDAGAVVRWGVPVGRLLLDACAVLTVGSLLVAAALHPAAEQRARRLAAGGAATWAAGAVLLAAASAWEATGLPPDRLPPGQLVHAVAALPPARALLLVAVLAAVSGLLAGRRRRPGAAATALVVAVVALTPTLYVGHSAHLADDRTATGALVVHVVAATGWLGGLAGLAIHVRAADPGLPAAVGRFSGLALGAYVALVGSGVLVALAGLGTSRPAWSSPYAALVATKVVLAAGLGLIGWAHRRWTIARLRAGRPSTFVRLVAVELVLMGVTLGSAVALSRTPGAVSGGLPAGDGSTAVRGREDLAQLAAAWRPEPVVTTAVVVGVVVLVRAALRDRRPRSRRGTAVAVLAPVAAGLLAVAVLGLPVADDGGPLVGSLAVQHLVLLLAVPALVAAGGWRAPPSRPGRLGGPATGLAAVVAIVLVVAIPSLRDVVASAPAAHVASLAVALGGGVLFRRTVLDPCRAAPRRAPARHRPVLAVAVLVLVAASAVVALDGPLVGAGAGPVAQAPSRPLADPLVAAVLLLTAAAWVGLAGLGRTVRRTVAGPHETVPAPARRGGRSG